MQSTTATYSYNSIQDCIKAVKNTSFTVNKKIEHSTRWNEIKTLFDLCYEKTDCILFDWEYTVCKDYIDGIKCKLSKKELDLLLYRCQVYLQQQINGIYTMMNNGEVNTI